MNLRLLVGPYNAGREWCRKHGVHPQARHVCYGITPGHVLWFMAGRDPRDVAITYVRGEYLGPEWDEAQARIRQFKAMGATVEAWEG